MKPLPIITWLETVNTRWVLYLRNLSVMRMAGGIEAAYGLAIIARPQSGPAAIGAEALGISPYWVAGSLLLCGLPMLIMHLRMDWFIVLIVPLIFYAVFAANWVFADPAQPATAIVANFSILLLLLKLVSSVAVGNHDHG